MGRASATASSAANGNTIESTCSTYRVVNEIIIDAQSPAIVTLPVTTNEGRPKPPRDRALGRGVLGRDRPILAFTDREGDEGRVVYSRCEHFLTRWNHKGPIKHVCDGHPRCEIALTPTVPIVASIDDDVQLKTLTAGIGGVGEPDHEPSVGTGSLLGATVPTSECR
jgi:hypothetical protein